MVGFVRVLASRIMGVRPSSRHLGEDIPAPWRMVGSSRRFLQSSRRASSDGFQFRQQHAKLKWVRAFVGFNRAASPNSFLAASS